MPAVCVSIKGLFLMDACLTLEPFRLPRPQFYSEVDACLIKEGEKEGQLIEEARERYGDIYLEVINIYRSKSTLGMAIEGGANTRQPIPRVINVQPGGSAFECGKLKVGHLILEVNGQSVMGLNHTEAAKTIAEAFKNKEREGMELLVTDTGADVKGAPESCEVFSIDL